VPLENQEFLARYIFFSNRVRASGTLKPETFMPHPYPDLSVTRHDALIEEKIWQSGRCCYRVRLRVPVEFDLWAEGIHDHDEAGGGQRTNQGAEAPATAL
jgi:hypothetical protein